MPRRSKNPYERPVLWHWYGRSGIPGLVPEDILELNPSCTELREWEEK